MINKSSRLIFLVSLIALYFYFNTCRRLLVSTTPSFLSSKLLSEELYGVLSSTTSIIFGLCRFIAYLLLEKFSVDSYVSILTITSCCIVGFLSLTVNSLSPDTASIILGSSFILLFFTVGLVFPSSSILIRRYFSGKERNFIWSLLSISSCIGSILAGLLCYAISDLSLVFRIVCQFGIACIICFYVFFPSEESSSPEEKKTTQPKYTLSKQYEYTCLFLCFTAYFLIYLSRRIMSEWSSVYLLDLFTLSEEEGHTMYTFSNTLYEVASILSLLFFGVLTSWYSIDLSCLMSIYTTLAIFTTLLPQLASSLHLPWLFYISSFCSGFFLSVPYASLDLVLMDLCTHVRVNRALSLTSLLSQIAAAVAGYPVYSFFTHICSFHYTPLVLTLLLCIAGCCLWSIYWITRPTKEKRD